MANADVSNDNHKLAKGKGVMINGEDRKLANGKRVMIDGEDRKLANGKRVMMINGEDDHEGDDEQIDHKKRKLEIRVSAERGRRRKMTKLYADLQALLPNLPAEPKVAKATIVKEAMDTIKILEQTLQNLQKQKLEMLQGHVSDNATTVVVPFVPARNPVIIDNNDDEPLLVYNQQQLGSSNIFETWTSPNVTISMCGTDAHISICSLKKPALFTTICFILKNHNHEIVSAQISSDVAKIMYMIHIRANVPPESAEGFPYEEMYKKAVTHIMEALGNQLLN